MKHRLRLHDYFVGPNLMVKQTLRMDMRVSRDHAARISRFNPEGEVYLYFSDHDSERKFLDINGRIQPDTLFFSPALFGLE